MGARGESGAAQGGGSQPRAHEAWPWLGAPAGSCASITEEGDGYARVREALGAIADAQGTWAGIPAPVGDLELVVEPSYPHAEALERISRGEEPGAPAEDRPDPAVIRNIFHSRHLKCRVYIYQNEPGGRVRWLKEPAFHGLKYAMNTLMASEAWGLEQEGRAVELLLSLIGPRKLKQYLLTGSFLDRSERSGVTYMFRRLRPTVAMTSSRERQEMRILCALCMHPIGYYKDSWGGAMAPTDDVVAHLVMMRADEAELWRRSSQHPPWLPNAGL